MRTGIGSNRKATSEPTLNPETRGERRLISPFRCRVWTQHSRPEEQLTEYACKSLRESIARNGQHQPALGRLVADDPAYDVEIICGARRHAAAIALSRDLIVELRTITDAEAFVAMYEENCEREDDSPYTQGQILRRALFAGACSSQQALATAFRISLSRVSRLLMIAQLPSIVVAAFPCPGDIRECWGVELYHLCTAKDPQHAVTTRARALANSQPRLPPREVYQKLITPTAARARPTRTLPTRSSGGVLLFRELDHTANVTFAVPRTILSPNRRDALKKAMVRILDPQTPEPNQAGTLGQSIESPPPNVNS